MLFDKKILFGIIIGGLIFGSLGVYATSLYNATDISYSSDDSEVLNVKDALDDLYENQKYFVNELVKADGNKIPSGVKKAYVFSETLTSYNYQSLSITGGIIVSQKCILSQSIYNNNTAAAGIHIYELELNGNEGVIGLSFSGGSGYVASYAVLYYLK